MNRIVVTTFGDSGYFGVAEKRSVDYSYRTMKVILILLSY